MIVDPENQNEWSTLVPGIRSIDLKMPSVIEAGFQTGAESWGNHVPIAETFPYIPCETEEVHVQFEFDRLSQDPCTDPMQLASILDMMMVVTMMTEMLFSI